MKWRYVSKELPITSGEYIIFNGIEVLPAIFIKKTTCYSPDYDYIKFIRSETGGFLMGLTRCLRESVGYYFDYFSSGEYQIDSDEDK